MKNIQAIVRRGLASLAVVTLITPGLVLAQWDKGSDTASGAKISQGTITDLLDRGLKLLLSIVAVLGIIGFVIAGIMYLTAAGDEKRAASGKQMMIWSITGIVIALLGYVVIQAIDTWLTQSSGNL